MNEYNAVGCYIIGTESMPILTVPKS